MKASNITCKLRHKISTMVICGSYMFEFSVSKDMKERKKRYNKGGDNRKGSGTFMSSTNCQGIENLC
jgi:hypothetical protein